jgi:hypothetical protein
VQPGIEAFVPAQAKSSRSVAGRCRLGKAIFAGMGGREEDTPKADLASVTAGLPGSDPLLPFTERLPNGVT